ncbi:MAG: hypothetical protein M1840_006601 [Geoglossum simile]|nr:MAG: hypothetical protein M1840_006601 [Geoglossum simile]
MSYRDRQPFPSFDPPPPFRATSYIDDITSKPSSTTALAYVALSAALAYYALSYMRLLPPALGIMWYFLVYIMPSKVIFLLDSFFSGPQGIQPGDATKSAKHTAKDQALRRLLGLDGAGILAKLNLARGGAGFNVAADSSHKGAPPGLGNWDNSCYQNSVIQALASLRPLSDYLEATLSDPNINWKSLRSKRMTTHALLDTIMRLNDPLNEGCRLWTPAELKSMRGWQQQDAQEYLSKVLDEIDGELLRAVKASQLSQRVTSHETLHLKLGNPLPSQNEDEGERDMSGISEISGITSGSVYMTRDSTVTPLSLIPHRNPVEGLVAQRVGCLRCGFSEGLSLIPFNCITVPLGSDWLYDLRDCLDEYTSLEMIEGVECANCTLLKNKTQLEQLLNQLPTPEASSDSSETCTEEQPSRDRPANPSSTLPDQLRNSTLSRLEAVTAALEDEDFSEGTLRNTCKIPPRNRVSTTKTRQAVIARAPKCLIVHINRSVFDELSGMQRKNYAKVQFQQTLDLGYWCLGSCVAEGDNREAIEEWEMGPGKSMLRGNISSVLDEMGPLYDLRAVVTHYGRHENGHYICYRKLTYPPVLGEGDSSHGGGLAVKPVERWWRISDDDVVPVTEEYVLEQGGAFMLFYEQVEIESANSSNESLLLPSQGESNEPDEAGMGGTTASHSSSDNPSCGNSAAECPPLSNGEVENSPELSETDSTSDDGTVSLFSMNSPESATTSNTDEHINDLSIHSTPYSNGVLGRSLESAKFPLVSEQEAGQHTTGAEESLEEA